ncbi:hypothetical protein FB451DRAFT_44970 [Mycena latifolia]|nr:hypothetical protein FB451DRAFT_44970 [Mycena latifolia]
MQIQDIDTPARPLACARGFILRRAAAKSGPHLVQTFRPPARPRPSSCRCPCSPRVDYRFFASGSGSRGVRPPRSLLDTLIDYDARRGIRGAFALIGKRKQGGLILLAPRHGKLTASAFPRPSSPILLATALISIHSLLHLGLIAESEYCCACLEDSSIRSSITTRAAEFQERSCRQKKAWRPHPAYTSHGTLSTFRLVRVHTFTLLAQTIAFHLGLIAESDVRSYLWTPRYD